MKTCGPAITCAIRLIPGVFLIATAAILCGCEPDPDEMREQPVQTTHLELYRPQFHYTPLAGWMNDPNGLIWHNGTWHLYHQFIPGTYVIDQMNWGHAESTDLIHWTYKPVAISTNPDLGMAYSGSAIADPDNVSGLCTSPASCILAFFTHSMILGGDQKQSIAVSNDGGRQFVEFQGNPIMPNPGIRDFRDPKVFEFTEGDFGSVPSAGQPDPDADRWKMVLSEGKSIGIYGSANMVAWEPLSKIDNLADWEGGAWECPDLFPMRVENQDRVTKWILMVGVFDGAPWEGSGVQYVVGDFDGRTFTPADGRLSPQWLDAGPDFYAAQSFSNVPAADGRRVIIGWMNNWKYALNIPAMPWQGMMSIPRELTLRLDSDGTYRLTMIPASETAALRRGRGVNIDNMMLNDDAAAVYQSDQGLFEIDVTASVKNSGDSGRGSWAVRITSGESTADVGVDGDKLFIDRTDAICPDCPGIMKRRLTAEIPDRSDTHSLKIFVDRTGIEVFADNGKVAMTALAFFPGPQWDVWLVAPESHAIARSFELFELFTTWPDK